MMYKVGEGMLGRLNLGGASGKQFGDLSTSQNIPKGEFGAHRSTIGMDKSMENFKLGFSQQFGNQISGASKLGGLDSLPGSHRLGGTFGAVAQPKMNKDENSNPLETSMQNILNTPTSSKNDEEL